MILGIGQDVSYRHRGIMNGACRRLRSASTMPMSSAASKRRSMRFNRKARRSHTLPVCNYDVLMDSAKESAIEQVSFLIQSASKGEVKIHVGFRENDEQVEQQDSNEE